MRKGETMKTIKETLVIAALTLPVFVHAADDAKKAPSLGQFAVYDATLTDFPGAKFNGELNLGVVPQYWSPPVSADDGATQRVVSKDNSMAIQFSAFADESEEVLTWRKDRDKKNFGALTVFKKQDVASHTYSYNGVAVTLTREVCELLRSQSNAKTLSEFAEKAQSCDSFYRMKPIPANLRNSLAGYKATHESNVRKLHSSFAKDAFPVPQAQPAPKKGASDLLGEFIESFAGGKEKGKEVTPEPHALVKSMDLFSLKASEADGSYRAALSDIAGKCVQFFPAPQSSEVAPAAKPAKGDKTAR